MAASKVTHTSFRAEAHPISLQEKWHNTGVCPREKNEGRFNNNNMRDCVQDPVDAFIVSEPAIVRSKKRIAAEIRIGAATPGSKSSQRP